MSEVNKKYHRLGQAALKLLEIDNAIIAALEKGDTSLMQPLTISRVLPIQTIRNLASWIPGES